MKRPLILLGLSAACFLLSFGLCGMSGGTPDNNRILMDAGLTALGLSIIGGIVSLIWLLTAVLRGK